ATLRLLQPLADKSLRRAVTLFERRLSQLQRHDRVHQPLLSAVVEVAAESAPLPIACLADSRPRVSQLAQRLLPRGVKVGILKRQERDGSGRLEQLWILRELLIVDDRCRWVPVLLDLGQGLTGAGGNEGRAVCCCPSECARAPEP